MHPEGLHFPGFLFVKPYKYIVMNHDSTVRVVADKYGNVINVCSNSEYGYIRVEQETSVSAAKSWINRKLVTALIMGKMEELTALKFYAGQELPGKIVVKESHDPFDLENPDRDLKYAGNTGIPCHAYGEPIYRKTFYTEDLNDDHYLIRHTNGDDIREALKTGKTVPQPGKWQVAGKI
jgi:hypothetical protein